jgi:predicted Fe-S protein YdhL (DUF1289 family)
MTASETVRSPCVDVCALDESDLCIGCHRTGDEISRWGQMTNDERKDVLRKIAAREERSAL